MRRTRGAAQRRGADHTLEPAWGGVGGLERRREPAERAFATITDPATTNLTRGSCRLTSLTPIALFTAITVTARNLRIADAFPPARPSNNAAPRSDSRPNNANAAANHSTPSSHQPAVPLTTTPAPPTTDHCPPTPARTDPPHTDY